MHTHTQKERERDRETDREREPDRQTERERERQMDERKRDREFISDWPHITRMLNHWTTVIPPIYMLLISKNVCFCYFIYHYQ